MSDDAIIAERDALRGEAERLRVDNKRLRYELDEARRAWSLGLAQVIRGAEPITAAERIEKSRGAAKIIFGVDEAVRPFPSESEDQRPCGRCGHANRCHLDESDRGWCTKPAGTCIYNPCSCTAFVEDAQSTSEDP